MNFINIQTIEKIIRSTLTQTREEKPEKYKVLSLTIYDAMKGGYPDLTAGTFNKIIGDMKRVGVVGTTKDGEVFLSDVAWQLHQSLCLHKATYQSGGRTECVLLKGHEGAHKNDMGWQWDNSGGAL